MPVEARADDVPAKKRSKKAGAVAANAEAGAKPSAARPKKSSKKAGPMTEIVEVKVGDGPPQTGARGAAAEPAMEPAPAAQRATKTPAEAQGALPAPAPLAPALRGKSGAKAVPAKPAARKRSAVKRAPRKATKGIAGAALPDADAGANASLDEESIDAFDDLARDDDVELSEPEEALDLPVDEPDAVPDFDPVADVADSKARGRRPLLKKPPTKKTPAKKP
jgi:hypothetical protein